MRTEPGNREKAGGLALVETETSGGSGRRPSVDGTASVATGSALAPPGFTTGEAGTEPETFDRAAHAAIARMTGGISPSALALAYTDWLLHLSASPGKQAELAAKAAKKWTHFLQFAARAGADGDVEACIEPLPHDRRFDAPEWGTFPYNLFSQGFLLTQQWWHNATVGVHGLSRHHENVVSFAARQLLDVWSPANFPFTNPEVLRQTIETGGDNFRQGIANWREDVERQVRRLPPVGAERFKPGETVAITPERSCSATG